MYREPSKTRSNAREFSAVHALLSRKQFWDAFGTGAKFATFLYLGDGQSRTGTGSRTWSYFLVEKIKKGYTYVIMTHLRIMLVDDHEVVRLGLKSLIERHPGFEVVAEASAAQEAVQKALAQEPDIVLMDIRLVGGSGIEACEAITTQLDDTKVIMLTSYAEDEMLFSAIRAGATGYVLKQISSEALINTIEAAARGESMLDPSLTQRVFTEVRRAIQQEEVAAFTDLTPQEMQVLAAIVKGNTNREIANGLFLSEGTVRNYVSSILSKLGVSNRAEAAAYAVQHHLKDYL